MRPGESVAPGAKSGKDKPDSGSKQSKSTRKADEQQPDEAQQGGWEYKGDQAAGTQKFATAPTPEISWTASEYIAHDKGPSWFVLVVLADIFITAFVYLITREWISSSAVGIGILLFAVYGVRPPRTLQYAIDSQGIHIGERSYPYGRFRSFSVMDEDALHSILLMPVKRFDLPITLYFDPADEEQIVNVIGGHLPHEERDTPPVDRLMSKIRF